LRSSYAASPSAMAVSIAISRPSQLSLASPGVASPSWFIACPDRSRMPGPILSEYWPNPVRPVQSIS